MHQTSPPKLLINTGLSKLSSALRCMILWPFGPPKKIDGFCSGRIEIATVAALLRNDISRLFSFLCILRIGSGARNDILWRLYIKRAGREDENCSGHLLIDRIKALYKPEDDLYYIRYISRCSSMAEHSFRKAEVVGSTPTIGCGFCGETTSSN